VNEAGVFYDRSRRSYHAQIRPRECTVEFSLKPAQTVTSWKADARADLLQSPDDYKKQLTISDDSG
jgi:hypothetical protein